MPATEKAGLKKFLVCRHPTLDFGGGSVGRINFLFWSFMEFSSTGVRIIVLRCRFSKMLSVFITFKSKSEVWLFNGCCVRELAK